MDVLRNRIKDVVNWRFPFELSRVQTYSARYNFDTLDMEKRGGIVWHVKFYFRKVKRFYGSLLLGLSYWILNLQVVRQKQELPYLYPNKENKFCGNIIR